MVEIQDVGDARLVVADCCNEEIDAVPDPGRAIAEDDPLGGLLSPQSPKEAYKQLEDRVSVLQCRVIASPGLLLLLSLVVDDVYCKNLRFTP
jgi:hypothetical protein